MSVESPLLGSQTQTTSARLVSLDVVRGIAMFWIIGAADLLDAVRNIGDSEATKSVADFLAHKAWEGFHFEDLGLPLFIFIVGISTVLSTTKTIRQSGRNEAVRRILRRAIVLFLLGIIYNGGFSTPFRDIRLLGVLQRIALCYLFAALLFCYVSQRTIVAVCAMLLLGYWALMTFVPVPGVGRANFAEGKNLANHIDKQYLPLKKYDGDHDPEGLLSTMPAIASCLLGVFAGMLLKNNTVSDQTKVFYLAGAGVAGVALGSLWALQFPVIKKIWTSSFVLVAGGYSALAVALACQVIDLWKYQRWAQPFVWIGMNSLTIFLAAKLIDFGSLAQLLVGGDINRYCGVYGPVILAAVTLIIELCFLHFLYHRKIFLRL